MVTNVSFRKTTNALQERLKKDCKDLSKMDKILVPADKTFNFYRVEKEQYKSLLMKNINNEYHKDKNSTLEDINDESKKIATSLGIEDRVFAYPRRSCFGNLKDHKNTFESNPTTRLLNPASNHLGKISKKIVEKICNVLREKLAVTQWKSTKDVITWFKGIENKKTRNL